MASSLGPARTKWFLGIVTDTHSDGCAVQYDDGDYEECVKWAYLRPSDAPLPPAAAAVPIDDPPLVQAVPAAAEVPMPDPPSMQTVSTAAVAPSVPALPDKLPSAPPAAAKGGTKRQHSFCENQWPRDFQFQVLMQASRLLLMRQNFHGW